MSKNSNQNNANLEINDEQSTERYCTISESIEQSFREIAMMRKGEIPKKSWEELCIELKEIKENECFLDSILEHYTFTANKFTESDGSITLELNEIPLVENALTEEQAKELLAQSILEYAEDFCRNCWGTAPNLKNNIPYVIMALFLHDTAEVKKRIKCQDE